MIVRLTSLASTGGISRQNERRRRKASELQKAVSERSTAAPRRLSLSWDLKWGPSRVFSNEIGPDHVLLFACQSIVGAIVLV
jgi:hypothetical protein